MAEVNAFIEKYGLIKLITLGTGLIGCAVFSFFMLNKISSPELGLLYGDLDPADGNRIVGHLEGMGVPHALKGNGTQVYAPLDKVGHLRMSMAEAGLPSAGSIGYEIFDKTETLGTTSFVQNLNRIRALEGELARTIKTISAIHSARVHLVMPNKSIFTREREDPKASVVLKLQGPGRLSRHKVAAIQHLVVSGVPGLSPERISIVDDRGTLLLKGEKSFKGAFDLDEARFDYERHLAHAIESLISRTVGSGKVRAEVTADLDFDRITESKEIFDPEGQVARQNSTVEEGQNSKESGESGAVSVGQNIPTDKDAAQKNANHQKSNRVEESVTFEISKTMRNHMHESGGIKRLSVAVLVDGNYATNQNGEETYTERTPVEMENIKKLVRSVVGFDEKRGDQLEVINMRFVSDQIVQNVDDDSSFLGMERHHFVRLIETSLFVLFGFLFLTMVIKPLVTSVIHTHKEKALQARLVEEKNNTSIQHKQQEEQEKEQKDNEKSPQLLSSFDLQN